MLRSWKSVFCKECWAEVFLSKAEAAGLMERAVLALCFAGPCESGALPGERGEPVPLRLGVHEIHCNHH